MKPGTGRESRRGCTAWYRSGAVATVQRLLTLLLLFASMPRATAQIGVGATVTRQWMSSAVTGCFLSCRGLNDPPHAKKPEPAKPHAMPACNAPAWSYRVVVSVAIKLCSFMVSVGHFAPSSHRRPSSRPWMP